jgi:hypothetical protein
MSLQSCNTDSYLSFLSATNLTPAKQEQPLARLKVQNHIPMRRDCTSHQTKISTINPIPSITYGPRLSESQYLLLVVHCEIWKCLLLSLLFGFILYKLECMYAYLHHFQSNLVEATFGHNSTILNVIYIDILHYLIYHNRWKSNTYEIKCTKIIPWWTMHKFRWRQAKLNVDGIWIVLAWWGLYSSENGNLDYRCSCNNYWLYNNLNIFVPIFFLIIHAHTVCTM